MVPERFARVVELKSDSFYLDLPAAKVRVCCWPELSTKASDSRRRGASMDDVADDVEDGLDLLEMDHLASRAGEYLGS